MIDDTLEHKLLNIIDKDGLIYRSFPEINGYSENDILMVLIKLEKDGIIQSTSIMHNNITDRMWYRGKLKDAIKNM